MTLTLILALIIILIILTSTRTPHPHPHLHELLIDGHRGLRTITPNVVGGLTERLGEGGHSWNLRDRADMSYLRCCAKAVVRECSFSTPFLAIQSATDAVWTYLILGVGVNTSTRLFALALLLLEGVRIAGCSTRA